MSAANIMLGPEDEALVQEKVRRGEFPSPEAVVSHALGLLRGNPDAAAKRSSPQERARRLRELFDEVDRDPPPRKSPLPDEAFDRGDLYDDRA